MKLIEQKAEILKQTTRSSDVKEALLDSIHKQIELAGRTCYKSTDKITEDSARPFVEKMISSKHTAMLEHGTVYLKCSTADCGGDIRNLSLFHYCTDPYSVCVLDGQALYITTNYRVIIENKWFDDLYYLCAPEPLHEKRYTFKLTTSIGVTRELNRHRSNSIAEQSTRYCNYSKDKFGNEISFCIPSWIDREELSAIGPYKRVIRKKDPTPTEYWITSLLNAEDAYMELIKAGWPPQQAREVLPLCTASEIVHTAFASDWRFFFDLRLFGKTGAPHPNMIQLANLMKQEAEKEGIWNDIMSQPSKFKN